MATLNEEVLKEVNSREDITPEDNELLKKLLLFEREDSQYESTRSNYKEVINSLLDELLKHHKHD